MTAAEIHECLEKLGKTADEVHTSLLVMGIRGERWMECQCPIANYIKSITSDIRVSVCDEGFDLAGCPGVLPLACQVFVDTFDRGRYPDLIAV